MKNNNKLLIIAMLLLAQATHAMHIRTEPQKDWNAFIDANGNTALHNVVAHLFKAEDNLNRYIYTYKNAIKAGANQLIANKNGSTPYELLKKCFKYKLFNAIDTDNRKQIQELLSSAPELCVKISHGLKGNLLEYAIQKNNIYAQALIRSCMHNNEFPKNSIEFLEEIAELL